MGTYSPSVVHVLYLTCASGTKSAQVARDTIVVGKRQKKATGE